MSEFVYKDYLPANARVIVSYNKGEKVKFSYPIERGYWKAVFKCAYPTVLGSWIYIQTGIMFYIAMYLLMPIWFVKYTFFPTVKMVEQVNDFYHVILPAILIFSYLLVVPLIITLILSLNKEWMTKWLPW